VPCGPDGSYAECARQHNIQMQDYSSDVQEIIKEVKAEGANLNPEYFGYDHEISDNNSNIAVSISIEISGGIGIGGVSGIGIVFLDGVYVFTEIGETSEFPGELTFGVGVEVEWDTESIEDYEGENIGLELTYAVGLGGSVGISLEPGEGFLDFTKITGISFSVELGGGAAYGGSVSYIISFKDVIDY
jgi:hypothetical protein